MNLTFKNAVSFNNDINGWDTSNVEFFQERLEGKFI